MGDKAKLWTERLNTAPDLGFVKSFMRPKIYWKFYKRQNMCKQRTALVNAAQTVRFVSKKMNLKWYKISIECNVRLSLFQEEYVCHAITVYIIMCSHAMMCAGEKKPKKFWQFWKYCEQKLSLALFHNYEHGLTINSRRQSIWCVA